MLIDEITIRLLAGDGGRGAVAFNKVRLSRGPTGGDGGRGANVYFEGVADINALMFFAGKKEMKAEDGRDGRAGEDLILKIPVWTTVIKESGYAEEMEHVGQRILAAGGGAGGKGNFKFRSAVNTSPKEFQEGLAGDTVLYALKLRLIADVGLVGLPNGGKSSLQNNLPAEKSRVANYAFTTLEPHLGAYYELIIADIPGIIEGASGGKGLGVKFLKHIERTKVLFHLVSAESDDPVKDHAVIRKELTAYSPQLAEKTEYVFLTKSDTVSAESLQEKLSALKYAGIEANPLSVLDTDSLEEVKKILNTIKEEKLSGRGTD